MNKLSEWIVSKSAEAINVFLKASGVSLRAYVSLI